MLNVVQKNICLAGEDDDVVFIERKDSALYSLLSKEGSFFSLIFCSLYFSSRKFLFLESDLQVYVLVKVLLSKWKKKKTKRKDRKRKKGCRRMH